MEIRAYELDYAYPCLSDGYCPSLYHTLKQQEALLWQRDRARHLWVEIPQLQNISLENPIVWHYLRDSTFSRFDTIPECDKHTDRHTTTAYTALSIASRGKKSIQSPTLSNVFFFFKIVSFNGLRFLVSTDLHFDQWPSTSLDTDCCRPSAVAENMRRKCYSHDFPSRWKPCNYRTKQLQHVVCNKLHIKRTCPLKSEHSHATHTYWSARACVSPHSTRMSMSVSWNAACTVNGDTVSITPNTWLRADARVSARSVNGS